MVKVPKGYRSRNVEDRRGRSRGGGGGGFGFPRRRGGGGLGDSMGGGGMGGGTMGGGGMPTRLPTSPRARKGCGGGLGLVLLIAIPLLLILCTGGGTDFMGDLATGPAPAAAPDSPAIEDAEDLVNFVLDEVQDFWAAEFERAGETYPEANLVVFDQGVSTDGCGNASSRVGPFYCPADSKAYIDLQFMLLLQDRLGAAGDFSQAYILAHEIGHHVQNVVGTNKQVRNAQQGASRERANQLSVRMELQADCLAGMWARNAEQKGILDAGDIEEGVSAAGSVGDDAIIGSANQEQFTHGSSAQRVRWFRVGFSTGDYGSCDTFEPDYSSL